jgi:hypothetical protein
MNEILLIIEVIQTENRTNKRIVKQCSDLIRLIHENSETDLKIKILELEMNVQEGKQKQLFLIDLLMSYKNKFGNL